MQKFVLRLKHEKYIQVWSNRWCSEAKEKRDKAWIRLKKGISTQECGNNILMKEMIMWKYMGKRRKIKNIDNCKYLPQLSDGYINGRLKNKHEIE